VRDSGVPARLGVFHAGAKLLDSGRLDPWLTERTEEIFEWFNKHLTAPRLDAGLARAVFWFRGEHLEMIQRLWELAILVEESGAVVELIHTTKPGWVRYADEFQVAAIPTRR
jgi:hypothetical protein